MRHTYRSPWHEMQAAVEMRKRLPNQMSITASVCPPFTYDSNAEINAVRGISPVGLTDRELAEVTDVAYFSAYPNAPQIPSNWEDIPSCVLWARAWLHIKKRILESAPVYQESATPPFPPPPTPPTRPPYPLPPPPSDRMISLRRGDLPAAPPPTQMSITTFVCPPFTYDSSAEINAVRGISPVGLTDRELAEVTDVAYFSAYPNAPQIPSNWEDIPSCVLWARAWLHIKKRILESAPTYQQADTPPFPPPPSTPRRRAQSVAHRRRRQSFVRRLLNPFLGIFGA